MAGNAETVGSRRGSHWRIAVWGAIAALMLLPVIAMQFTDEVAWTAFDFAVMGVLLVGAGLALELAAWKIGGTRYRIVAGVAIIAVVLLIWAEGAVGILH